MLGRTHVLPLVTPSCLALALAFLSAVAGLKSPAQSYKVTNIVSDGSVPATSTDANFINPWGISASGTWWINTQGTGFSYVVPSTGTIAFKVIVPSASGGTTATGSPTGSVTTAGATGMILPNGTKASFLFSTLDGTISGWNSKLGTANALSQIAINNSAAGASYPGLAILNTATASYILAPNFNSASIEVYDSTFKSTTLAGTFTDPSLPANYAPYPIHILNNQVFVAYAQRTTAKPYSPLDGPGHGVVSIFDATGKFVSRAVTGGNLNSPWGVAFAPANFGIFSNDLLVANEGDGLINAYDPKTFAYIGQLMDSTGKSFVYEGLWELLTGGTTVGGTTSVSGGDTSTVYFTAGLHNEVHGLFAAISNTTTTGAAPAFGFTSASSVATVTAGSSVDTALSLTPVNGFSGTVTLSCTGLPVGATCNFAPAQITATPTAATAATVTISTSKGTASLSRLRGTPFLAGFTPLLLLPVSIFFAWRLARTRRSFAPFARLSAMLLSGLLVGATLIGCGNNYGLSKIAPTPAGQFPVVVTATAGTITQQTTISLTVQ